MANEDPSAIIKITHPDLGDGVAEVTVEAFETIWKDKGFKRLSDQEASKLAADAAQAEIIGETPKKGGTK